MSGNQGDAPRRDHGLPPPSPFQRLSRVHALMTAGDAFMAISLADSLCLSISPDAARTRVILFLAVSMAPFAVVAPLIGPLIDRMRGGQRIVVMVVAVLRAAVLVGMASSLDSLTLFPLAFAALVLSKTYAVSKSALVPVTVPDPERFVEANSRLGLIAGIAGFVVAAPAVGLQVIDPRAPLVTGALAFLAAGLNARRLPRVVIADSPPDALETEELHQPEVVAAAIAMRALRVAVGFQFFHLAFWLRSEIAGTAWFGLAIAVSSLSTNAANLVGPRVRERMRNQTMLVTALALVTVAGAACAWWNRVTAGVVLTGVVYASAAIGRLAFEATVQENAPDANRGRVFARFEAQNQLAWVAGGLVPVAVSPSGWIGFAMVGAVGAAGAWLHLRTARDLRGLRDARATNRGRRSRSESGGGTDQ
ncbi:MAG: hypothetical protein ACKOQ7_02035 [Actinomycetota bacterium]